MKEIYLNGEKSRYIIYDNLDVYNDRRHKIKPIKWSKGRYEMYSFNHKGQKVRRLRHRLIGEYFLELPYGDDFSLFQINHKDGNGLNNELDNLEWVTMEENIRHSFDNNLSSVGGTPYKKLSLTNTITGEVEVFDSIRQASIQRNISLASLSQKSNKSKTFTIKHFKIEMLDNNI